MQDAVGTRNELPARLTETLFADRGQQFVERLRWNLCVTPAGHEVDEYDDGHSAYIIVHREGVHLGSCRVRPTSQSTMIADHFLETFPDSEGFMRRQRGRLYELTRFCRNPDISVGESRDMLRKLATLLDRFRDEHRLTGFVAVVFPEVARFLDTIGVRYLVISQSKLDQRSVWMICITHAVRAEETHRAAPPALHAVGHQTAVAA